MVLNPLPLTTLTSSQQGRAPGAPCQGPTPRAGAAPPDAPQFSHKGTGLGFPWTGNILFSGGGGRGAGSARPLCIPRILGSSRLQLPWRALGALAWCCSVRPGCVGCPLGHSSWGVLWIWGDRRPPPCVGPTHPCLLQEKKKILTRKQKSRGLDTASLQGFLLSALLVGSQAHPLSPEKALDSGHRQDWKDRGSWLLGSSAGDSQCVAPGFYLRLTLASHVVTPQWPLCRASVPRKDREPVLLYTLVLESQLQPAEPSAP